MKNPNKRKIRASRTHSAAQPRLNFQSRCQQWWTGKSPVLKYVLSFGALMTVFYGFWVTDFFDRNILTPVLDLNAGIASKILNLFGRETSAVNGTIVSPLVSISVKRGCDALEPIALFTTALLVFPISFNRKLPGIAIGALVLLLANLIRIVSLFMIKADYPSAFEMMHINVWQVVFVLLVIVLWSLWIQWAAKSLHKKRHSTESGVS